MRGTFSAEEDDFGLVDGTGDTRAVGRHGKHDDMAAAEDS